MKNEDDTFYNRVDQLYLNSGHKKPKIIFWNLNASGEGVPVKSHESGAALVSGFSPALEKSPLFLYPFKEIIMSIQISDLTKIQPQEVSIGDYLHFSGSRWTIHSSDDIMIITEIEKHDSDLQIHYKLIGTSYDDGWTTLEGITECVAGYEIDTYRHEETVINRPEMVEFVVRNPTFCGYGVGDIVKLVGDRWSTIKGHIGSVTFVGYDHIHASFGGEIRKLTGQELACADESNWMIKKIKCVQPGKSIPIPGDYISRKGHLVKIKSIDIASRKATGDITPVGNTESSHDTGLRNVDFDIDTGRRLTSVESDEDKPTDILSPRRSDYVFISPGKIYKGRMSSPNLNSRIKKVHVRTVKLYSSPLGVGMYVDLLYDDNVIEKDVLFIGTNWYDGHQPQKTMIGGDKIIKLTAVSDKTDDDFLVPEPDVPNSDIDENTPADLEFSSSIEGDIDTDAVVQHITELKAPFDFVKIKSTNVGEIDVNDSKMSPFRAALISDPKTSVLLVSDFLRSEPSYVIVDRKITPKNHKNGNLVLDEHFAIHRCLEELSPSQIAELDEDPKTYAIALADDGKGEYKLRKFKSRIKKLEVQYAKQANDKRLSEFIPERKHWLAKLIGS